MLQNLGETRLGGRYVPAEHVSVQSSKGLFHASGSSTLCFAFMEGRRLLERGSLWSSRKLSFDLTEESGLDFKKAFKTAIPHCGVPKWMVESRRKPQVALGQKESGGRCGR